MDKPIFVLGTKKKESQPYSVKPKLTKKQEAQKGDLEPPDIAYIYYPTEEPRPPRASPSERMVPYLIPFAQGVILNDLKIIKQMTEQLEDKSLLDKVIANNGESEIKFEGDFEKESSPEIKQLVQATREAIKYIIEKKDKDFDHYLKNTFGQANREKSDDFAENMGEILDRVRSEGYTSKRKIAERLNELNIETARGGEKWHSTTVHNLIKRRQKLGLEPTPKRG